MDLLPSLIKIIQIVIFGLLYNWISIDQHQIKKLILQLKLEELLFLKLNSLILKMRKFNLRL